MFAGKAGMRRRALLAAALGAALPALATSARAQPPAGQSGYHGGLITPPVPVPDMPLHTADGRATRLRTLLAGRATALQLFYTGCSSTCTSYTTRLMPRTSLMIRFDARPSSAYGRCAQCAVMKSVVCTARSAVT